MKGLWRLGAAGLLAVFGGCASAAGEPGQGDDLHMRRLLEHRKVVRENPGDEDYIARLRWVERQAASHFLAEGRKHAARGEFTQAIQKFELGLMAEPGAAVLQQERAAALKRREVARIVAEEQRARVVGNLELAQSLIEKARLMDANNESLRQEARRIEKERSVRAERGLIKAFVSAEPVVVNFRGARMKDALKALSETHGLNYVFDPSVEDAPVSLSAGNVTLKQAFSMILQSGGAAYKALGPNSVLIYQNTPEQRAKYADMYYRAFHLYNMKADKMAELLKAHMELKSISVNGEMNTVQVREAPEVLDVIEKLVSANDRTPAEIMLDVEIQEISRTRAEQLGFDYGTSVSMSFPGGDGGGNTDGDGGKGRAGVTAAQFVNGRFLRDVLGGASVSLPSVTFKYMQKEVGGRVLAKPTIRTMDGRPAKIHIGDRVPLRSSTVQDVTGQSRTMYEYRDIGIKLEILPKYHLDDTVTVELTMEVSSLGDNLGSLAEPAYAIGTRNVTTTMLLREGETALLGGLIRDEERRTMNKVPGLGETDVIGALFSNKDESGSRTDVVLSITPKVIREQALPLPGGSSFYGGGAGGAPEAAFDYLKEPPASMESPRFKLTPAGGKEETPPPAAPHAPVEPNIAAPLSPIAVSAPPSPAAPLDTSEARRKAAAQAGTPLAIRKPPAAAP